MKRNQLIGAVVAIIIVAGGAFYAGMTYAKGQAPARGTFTTGSGGAAGFGARGGARTSGAGGGLVAGQIVSSGNGSISIQMQNSSSSEIVLLGPSTQILKSVSGSASDLTVGTNVVVTGTTNSDGSLSAQSIQLRPAGSSNAPFIRATTGQ